MLSPSTIAQSHETGQCLTNSQCVVSCSFLHYYPWLAFRQLPGIYPETHHWYPTDVVTAGSTPYHLISDFTVWLSHCPAHPVPDRSITNSLDLVWHYTDCGVVYDRTAKFGLIPDCIRHSLRLRYNDIGLKQTHDRLLASYSGSSSDLRSTIALLCSLCWRTQSIMHYVVYVLCCLQNAYMHIQ